MMKYKIQKWFSQWGIFRKKKSQWLKFRGCQNDFFRWKHFCQKKANPPDGEILDEDIYSLNRYQLKNLLDKNIHFGFFQLEDCSFKYDPETEALLKRVQRTTGEELLFDLKDQDLQQPLVLLCKEGLMSKTIAQKLRDRGVINAYFVQGGIRALLKDEE